MVHIQDHNESNTTLKRYFGYPSRVLPCTKDAGTCAYLDAVYGMHATSMVYTFVMWAVILGLLLIWTFLRLKRMEMSSRAAAGGFLDDLGKRAERFGRSLVPHTPLTWLFGGVSRLQLAILAVILAYLLIFSLVGIIYKTWITPIKGSDLHNIRTGIGGWADRIGALAYALTPFAVLLCQRESLLSVITGIPYQHFNFLHRWLGRVIFIQSFLHTLGWTLVEAKLYQPQPFVYKSFISQQYAIFGVVAMALITWLTLFSTKWAIKWMGYEVFRISHSVVAVLYIGACWGHWDKLWCWMVPSLALIVIDQGLRLSRTLFTHYYPHRGHHFTCAQARVTTFRTDGIVVRLDFEYEHAQPWEAGQHFYLTFPSLSIWQAHPFTVSSPPRQRNGVLQRHTYLIRVRDGQTKQLATTATNTIPAILSGPYGNSFPRYESQHILAIGGGTGVTFTYPIIQAALQQFTKQGKAVLDFVWVIRKAEDTLWLNSELTQLISTLDEPEGLGLRISIFITRQSRAKHSSHSTLLSTSSNNNDDADDTTANSLLTTLHPRFKVHFLHNHHPAVADIVSDFVDRASTFGGRLEILGSGPEAMGSDLRAAVAGIDETSGGGDGVEFYWDSRE